MILPNPSVENWSPTVGKLFGMHLILADKVLADSEYRDNYLERKHAGEYIILDNGAAENGVSLGSEELLEAARLVEADEIVAPDVLEDSQATIEQTESFLSEMAERLRRTKLRIMVVPQGTNGYEWQMCAQTLYGLLESLGLSQRIIIGVPKHMDSKVTGGRINVLDALIDGWGAPFKFHLLGSGELLCRDIAGARMLKEIRSLDTSLPAALAQADRSLSYGVGRNGVQCDFTSDCDNELLGRNLLEVYKWNRRKWRCPTGSNFKEKVAGCAWCPLMMK